uniref:Hes A n=1 Tax=Crepidula fornicata TaxID=176853 RepID=A0A1U8Y0M3_CREFO|nr:Hes A [Crepidula fornicata]
MHSDRVTTTGSEGRKSSKPIMEKRRRARINASLAELKSLLLEVIKKEGARHSKMEKADILEMAVKHLRHVQRQQYTSGGADPTLSDKYRLGFNECAQEVSRYLGAADDDDAELRARLLNHLANCVTNSDSSPLSTPSTSPAPLGHSPGSSGGVMSPVTPIPVRPVSAKGSVTGLSLITQGEPGGSPPAGGAVLVPTTEINNNVLSMANNNLVSSSGSGVGELRAVSQQLTLSPATSSPLSLHAGRKVVGEVQVVGAKQGTGEVALVLPANVMTGGLPSYIIPVYASPHTLSTASFSLAPTTQQASLPLSVMATTTSAAGNAPSVVTLTPGATLSPTVLPPASVGHVLATGLNGPLAWQAATPLLSSPSSVSSTTSSLLQGSPVSLTGLSPTLAASTVTSEAKSSEVSSAGSVCLGIPTQAFVPSPVLTSAVPAPVADSSDACVDSAGRSSLLLSQAMRPPPPMGHMQAADGSMWRPW